MPDLLSYGLVVHDQDAETVSALHATELMDAEVVVGKDRRVLKDRHGTLGKTLTRRELDDILGNAAKIRVR